jgi:hypothetical protein
MWHLTLVNWIQLTLIEIGVLFQVIAISAHIKETSVYRRFMHSKIKVADVHKESLESEVFGSDHTAPDQTEPQPESNLDEEPHTEIKAGHLMKTSQLKFVQSFKFREQEPERPTNALAASASHRTGCDPGSRTW